jgi:hypothetical protein
MTTEDKMWQTRVAASWREPTLDEIAAQQGITEPQPFDELLGAGKNLWKDDKELDIFLKGIYDRRRGIYNPE